MNDPIVIVGFARTPIGALQGKLSVKTAPQLGSYAISGALKSAKLSAQDISEVIMGCVLQAGIGQAPARQAALAANIPQNVPSTTVNKMCGSGMQTIMYARDMLIADPDKIIVAGGMESMTNAPYLINKARSGYRMGHGQLTDHMFLDGLEDAYDSGKLMGCFAEETAKKYNISREMQDEFALSSLQKAKDAIFTNEIVPIDVILKRETVTVATDEAPENARPEKIPKLNPAFAKDGTVTAANSSSIADGAAALVMMRMSTAKQKNLQPIAIVAEQANYAHEPNWFTTAPIGAINKLLNKTTWNKDDIDLFEINEAFAVVTLAAIQELQLDPSKVNVHGGACALGHPIGCSGARIVCTLINALQVHNKAKGIASACIGGGEATAIAIEII